MTADFQELTGVATRLADILTNGRDVVVQTGAGADMRFNVEGRRANPAPGWCWAPGSLASPPDAETNIAVVERASEGTVVVDGSIPCAELGLLDAPIHLKVENGQVVQVTGEQAEVVQTLFANAADPNAKIVAELGIGLNPLAELCGIMLEDEGCLGTVHLGIGSNATIGGENTVSFHLDFVIRQATVAVDGQVILKEGSLID
jgi:leucyl aminopeptidase (aminopeptidase T)